MNAHALHAPTDNAGLRWTFSAAVILALHAALIAAGIGWYREQPPTGVEMPAIMIDMAPASAAPETQPMDVAPGPEMQQADEPTPPPPPPPPEPMAQAPVEEPVAPTPLVEKPEVEAPPEQKAEPAPEPTKITPEPPQAKPEPVKPKPVRAKVQKKQSETPPAPRTSAAPRAERKGRAAAAATAGAAAAAAALPSYRDRLAAHLQRYKQYPESAKSAGKQGVAMLSFTVGRNGQVLASRLAGSSGIRELDAETMAMIRRAQPLPAFPPEMTQASLSFTVPVRFSIR
ncbi:energy transducer TonB [soil metagenome]